MNIIEKESVKKALNKIVKEEGLDNHEIAVSRGSKPGDNYGGAAYKILIKNKNKQLNLFVKLIPETSQINLHYPFHREAMMYNEIIPKLFELQESKNVQHKFKSITNCYSASSVKGEEYILLNDLSEEGFELRSKYETIDYEHCKIVMEELGKLHALSFALKDQYPEFIDQYKDKFPEIMFKNPMTEEFYNLFTPFANYAKDSLKIEEKYQQQWKNFIDNYIEHGQNCCNGELAGKYRIITHGDCWNNNTMYRYENGKPVEMRFLDFQVSRYSSPVIDLMQFIFTATEKPLRDLHYQDLLATYHNNLTKFLSELGSNPEELFPYTAFLEQLKQFGKYGLCISILGTQMVWMREPDGYTVNMKNKDKCDKIMTDAIHDMASWGYI